MVQVQVPGTCLLCGLNTKFLSSHFAQQHSTHSFFPRGARCPCGHVASVLQLRTHQDATPVCRLKYRDNATPPPKREIPPASKVVVEIPSPSSEWRQQYSQSDALRSSALLRKREREAIETLHDLRTRDPAQYSRNAAYVLLDDTYGSQPKRTPSEASTYTPSGDERRSRDSSDDSSGSSAAESDASVWRRRRGAHEKAASASSRDGRRRSSTRTRTRTQSASSARARSSPPSSAPPEDDFEEYDFDAGVDVSAATGADADADERPDVINLMDDSSDEEDEEDDPRRPAQAPVALAPPAAASSPQPAGSPQPTDSPQPASDTYEYCGMCMKVYDTPKDLYMHMLKVHERDHITEDDFTSKTLFACACGRVCALRGLPRHRELTCRLSEAARKRDAISGLEAKRRALLGYSIAGGIARLAREAGSVDRGVPSNGSSSKKKASSSSSNDKKASSSSNHNNKYPGTCNICNRLSNDLYNHLWSSHGDRQLVPGDITAEGLRICRCGKAHGLSKMALLLHSKRCPYVAEPPVSERSTNSPPGAASRPSAAAPLTDAGSPAATAPLKHVGRCNICKREVTDVYQHLRNHTNRRLKPKHITCDTLEICRCGKTKAKTRMARMMHDSKGCPYAGEDDSVAAPVPGRSAPPASEAHPTYASGNRKYPGTCNICRKFCNDLYMHLRGHSRRLKPGDITCDTLAICKCGKAKGLSPQALLLHDKKCKYASQAQSAPSPVPPVAARRSAAGTATATATATVPPNEERGGTCNLCGVYYKWIYNHMQDSHRRRHLKAQDITASSWMVCACGKMRGLTEGARRKHAFSCPQGAPPPAPEADDGPVHYIRSKRPRESDAAPMSEPENHKRRKHASKDDVQVPVRPSRVRDPDSDAELNSAPRSRRTAASQDDDNDGDEYYSARSRSPKQARPKRRERGTSSDLEGFELNARTKDKRRARYAMASEDEDMEDVERIRTKPKGKRRARVTTSEADDLDEIEMIDHRPKKDKLKTPGESSTKSIDRNRDQDLELDMAIKEYRVFLSKGRLADEDDLYDGDFVLASESEEGASVARRRQVPARKDSDNEGDGDAGVPESEEDVPLRTSRKRSTSSLAAQLAKRRRHRNITDGDVPPPLRVSTPSEEDEALATPPATVLPASSLHKNDRPENQRRSAPKWMAVNSPERTSRTPNPQRMRLSGIDMPQLPAQKHKKRPRHSMPA